MARRKKSIDDIEAQRQRIQGLIWNNTDSNFNTPEGYAAYQRQSSRSAKADDMAQDRICKEPAQRGT